MRDNVRFRRGLTGETPDEVAAIEAEKARIRAAKVAQLVHGPNGNGVASPPELVGRKAAEAEGRPAPPPVQPVSKPESAGTCPDCGRPFGRRRRRCYYCKPTSRGSRKAAGRAATPPAVRPTPDALLREMDVCRGVLAALAGVDRAEAIGALRWVLGRMEGSEVGHA